MWRTSRILHSCLKQKQHFCRCTSVKTAVFGLGENIFPPCLLPPAKLSAALPTFCRRGEAATGRLPAGLPVPPPEVAGMFLLPWGSRRAAGKQIGHCWLFLVCARVSLCKFGSAWFPWLSKLCGSSRLRRMCIMRKTKGEKITARHATLQDGSSVMLVLREHLELEKTGTHICQHTSTPARRPKRSALHRPCHTADFCPDAGGGQLVSQALQSFRESLCLSFTLTLCLSHLPGSYILHSPYSTHIMTGFKQHIR